MTDRSGEGQAQGGSGIQSGILDTVFAEGLEPILVTRLRDGLIVNATPGFCALLGRKRGSVIGSTTGELDLWVDGAGRGRMIAALSERGAVSDLDLDLRTSGGTVRTVRISAQMIAIDGEPHIFSVVRDVTELLAAEQLRRDLERRYRTLVEQVPAATYVDDSDGSPLYVSPQIEAIYECTQEQWLADAEFRLRRIHPDDAGRVRAWWQQRTARGLAGSYECRLMLPSGEVRWIHDQVAPVAGEPDRPRLTQGVMVDITEHRLAQERLRTKDIQLRRLLKEMLRAEERERGRIATELHDDTIQVMTAALLALDRTGRSETGAALQAARSALREAIDRTRRLTFQLRPQLLAREGLAAALGALVDETRHECDWETDLVARLGRYDVAVEDLVYRTIQELVTNARKHSRARHLSVSAAEAGREIRFSVEDDGVGFDQLLALDRNHMRHHLGLDAVIERVELAGGSLEVTSIPGQGTAVTGAIPVGRGGF